MRASRALGQLFPADNTSCSWTWGSKPCSQVSGPAALSFLAVLMLKIVYNISCWLWHLLICTSHPMSWTFLSFVPDCSCSSFMLISTADALVSAFCLLPMPGDRDAPAPGVANRLKLQQSPNSEAEGFTHWCRYQVPHSKPDSWKSWFTSAASSAVHLGMCLALTLSSEGLNYMLQQFSLHLCLRMAQMTVPHTPVLWTNGSTRWEGMGSLWIL